MIAIAVVIGAATAVGVGAELRLGEAARRAARQIMRSLLWVLVPVVVFFNIAHLELSAEVGAGIGFGYAAIAASMGAAYLAGRWLQLPRTSIGALVLVSGLGNTGYLGLPFSAALFGLDSLPDAVAYDTLVSTTALVTVGFSVGAAFGTRGEGMRERLVAFLARNPPLWATVAGLLAPSALAPDLAVDGSRLLVFLILPLGFFAVGVTLADAAEQDERSFPPALTPPVGAAVAFKLGLSPAVVLGLSALLLDVPDPYLVQPAMACAVNSLMVANEYGLDRRLCAAAITYSTAVVVAVGLVVALL